MSCYTEQGQRVESFVRDWIAAHDETQGVWGVFEDQLGLDVIVSIHQPDGVRRLTLTSQQAAAVFTGEVQTQISDWLGTLPRQPTVKQ